MVLVWRGAGLFTLACYVLILIAVNIDVLLHYTSSRFGEMNWWLPALCTAAFNAWLTRFVRLNKDAAGTQPYIVRLFRYLGSRHHIFWIPLPYWTAIYLLLGL